MANERENTVPAAEQLAHSSNIRGEGNGHPRVLFLGNSVTLHAPKEDIGWYGDWGMAASCEDNDYVHVFMKKFREKYPEASWRIGQLAEWERAFWTDEAVLDNYAVLREWKADIICSVILGANTPSDMLKEHDYGAHYAKMLDYFDPERTAKVAVTDMFWASAAKDEAVRRAAAAHGAALVGVNDMGETDEMMAIGKFEHHGVSIHPGDHGMKVMAERLLKALGED